MNDATRRAIRTFLQVGLVEACMQLYDAFAALPLTVQQHTAIILVATPVVVLAQNLLEDQAGMPALLKAPASAGANPVPDSGPQLERH